MAAHGLAAQRLAMENLGPNVSGGHLQHHQSNCREHRQQGIEDRDSIVDQLVPVDCLGQKLQFVTGNVAQRPGTQEAMHH